MPICINCGKGADTCLCASCRQTADIEILCNRIMEYSLGREENKFWDNISEELRDSRNFKYIVFALADELETPRKEYRRILCMAGDSDSVSKPSRQWLYDKYTACMDSEKLSELERNRIKGLVLNALYKDYCYEAADNLANEIVESKEIPRQAYMTLAEFYTTTRRYDVAEEILSKALEMFVHDEAAVTDIENLLKNNTERRDGTKKEYMPNAREAKQKYVDFLVTLGIEVPGGKASKVPDPIPKDQYPDPIETRDANFDTFVAFDLETTGRNSKIDSIIEIGAIKVVDGKVVDSKEFVFQEFVKPFKRTVSDEIQQLTGIYQDDVKNAREMWEVTPDFMRFVGDNTLVGFNCVVFDSRFMVRAGRYSHVIIENKYFDVMRYADKFKEQLNLEIAKCSLEQLSHKLGVENPRAHRALADAMTTAQVFLKLKEMDKDTGITSVDDMLTDISDW